MRNFGFRISDFGFSARPPSSVIPSGGGAACAGVAEREAASDAVVEGSPEAGDSRRSAFSGEVGGSFDSGRGGPRSE